VQSRHKGMLQGPIPEVKYYILAKIYL